jgi:hypothetical protein
MVEDLNSDNEELEKMDVFLSQQLMDHGILLPSSTSQQ